MAGAKQAVNLTSSDTVTVGCKLPNGLLCRVFEMVEANEPVLGGGYRAVKMAQPIGSFKLNGNAVAIGERPKHDIRFGYAITPNVSAELWELWLEQNKDTEIVKNGLVFAAAKAQDVSAEAKEKRAIKSGLEPLDPNNLPMRKIKTATQKDED